MNMGASMMAQWVKNLPALKKTQEMGVQSLGWEDPLEEEIVTHSSILAWKFDGQGSLVGYSPKGGKELDMTEHECGQSDSENECKYLFESLFPIIFSISLEEKLLDQ